MDLCKSTNNQTNSQPIKNEIVNKKQKNLEDEATETFNSFFSRAHIQDLF